MASSPVSSDIDFDPPPAVKSLRSKFEQLALDANRKPPPSTQTLLLPESAMPRPRAASSSESPPPDTRHLRTSSSSSDLKAGIKRPPPPPPPRASNAASPSPSPSPLLRPVPIPATVPVIYNEHPPDTSSKNPILASLLPTHEASDTSPSDSVASLRSKFSNSSFTSLSRNYAPQPNSNEEHPAFQSEQKIANKNPPAVPPRPSKKPETSRKSPLTLSHVTTDETRSPSISNPSLHSPFDIGDSDTDGVLASGSSGTVVAQHGNHQRSSSGDLEVQSSGSSRNSSESYSRPSLKSRPGVPPPPRPPPRPKLQAALSTPNYLVASSNPPPLPIRRSPNATVEEMTAAPPLPIRPLVIPAIGNAHDPPCRSPKLLGATKLPPPPTRVIAPGDKLPPVRRPMSPSSGEESGDEEDPKSRLADSLPDSSHSSRRPPVLSIHEFTESEIQVPAYSGHVAVSSEHVVVATQHHLRLFNLLKSDSCVHSLDGKDLGFKDLKTTCLEIRHATKPAEKGFFLWLGTKEGHLFELDIRTFSVVGTKLVAHSHSISHIFRHGRSMVTLDLSGKVLIFTPDGIDDVWLAYTQPKVCRIAEKQEFAKILAGRLWTSARSDMNGVGTMGKSPVIRLYDIFSPGCASRFLTPTEQVGAVTSGTVLPSQPQYVYLGHESGFITLWATDTTDGLPQCIEVVKVSISDVLSLEGVNDRLWAGGRKGTITAYDVAPRPWVVTNCWMAHDDLPVMKLFIDYYGIQRMGRLRVISVGRDERIRFWDGLLGEVWIDQELQKREASFSRFRNLTLLIISWNVDAGRPESLQEGAVNVDFLQKALQSVDSPDIIAFGLQEVIDLESRKMTAKNVLLGSKKKEDGGLSEKVTSGYKKWHDQFLLAVRLAMPPDVPYTVTHTESLVGLFSCILMKKTERGTLQDVAVTTAKRGMGGRYGNKGAIIARFMIEDSSICLINCHLAAGQHHVRQRNADLAGILEETAFPVTRSSGDAVAYAGGGDGSMVFDHEIVFLSGDLNYRIDQRREPVISAIYTGNYENLLTHDQLMKEMKHNRGFRLRQFTEGPITFAPTYKYDPRSSEYDTSEKSRVPAWCDRILWRSCVPSRVQQLSYERYEANVSDHRPISAGFSLTIKSIRHDVRAKVKAEVGLKWIEHQESLLSDAYDFYVSQALI